MITCPDDLQLTVGSGGVVVAPDMLATATSPVGDVTVLNDFTGACVSNTDYTDMVGCRFFWSYGQEQIVTFTGNYEIFSVQLL